MLRSWFAVLIPLCCLLGCGGSSDDDGTDAGPTDAAASDATSTADGAARADADLAAPLSAPDRTWTFIPFPDSSCDDGTPTGIGVNLAASAPGVLIYLNGGGECFDYNTCYVLNSATHGPFGATQFTQIASNGFAQSILDRNLAGSPFAAWSHIFVPYCTGDLHTGERDTTYTMGANSRLYHHRGRSNLRAYLRRIVARYRILGKRRAWGREAWGVERGVRGAGGGTCGGRKWSPVPLWGSAGLARSREVRRRAGESAGFRPVHDCLTLPHDDCPGATPR